MLRQLANESCLHAHTAEVAVQALLASWREHPVADVVTSRDSSVARAAQDSKIKTKRLAAVLGWHSRSVHGNLAYWAQTCRLCVDQRFGSSQSVIVK